MPPNMCPVCDKEFSTLGAVHDHAWNAHSACHYCGEQFNDDEGLYTHWILSHPNELSKRDYKRANSTVESISFTDRLSKQGAGAAVGSLQRRALLLAGGTAVVGGAAAVGKTLNKTKTSSTVGEPNSGEIVEGAPLPSSIANHQYAVAGTGNTDITVTYFGNWKCPYCAQFSTGFLSTLITDYVKPGEITLKYRNIAYIGGDPFLGPDAPAAAQAGLAVWNNDPDSYWRYHEYVFQNQPPESKQWATTERLMSFAEETNVSDPSVIRSAIQGRRYEDALRKTSDDASAANIQGTPTLLVDGTTVSPFEEDKTRRVIESAIA